MVARVICACVTHKVMSLILLMEQVTNNNKSTRLFHCGSCGKAFNLNKLLPLSKHALERCEQCEFVPITRKDMGEKFDLCYEDEVARKDIHNTIY